MGRAGVFRDLMAFLRLECLGALARSGLATALRTPGTAAELAQRAGLVDVELTTALLDLAVAHHQVRRRDDVYEIRSRRLRAVASDDAADVTGTAEDATAYAGPIYAAIADHLRGAPARPYDAGLGDVIARVSRVAEPVVGPWVEERIRSLAPQRVLDVGCGTGVNVRWIAGAAPAGAEIVGIDLDADAVALARANVAAWGRPDIAVHQADVEALPPELRSEAWDVVLLAQNIYYWPVEGRAALLARLRGLVGGQGTVLLLTAVPGRNPIGRHLDLVVRVTEGCSRLPTMDELRAQVTEAGFSDVDVREIVPGAGMAAIVARG
jgi:SAM-dependent methyltransferase